MGVAAGDASGAFASSSAAAAREEDARAGAYGPPAGALSASLEEGPALAPARGRLATGARLAHGFRPGRVVSRSRDGAETREWACRGDILHHLLRVRAWAVAGAFVVEDASDRPPPSTPRDDPAASAARPATAVAHVVLALPARLELCP